MRIYLILHYLQLLGVINTFLCQDAVAKFQIQQVAIESWIPIKAYSSIKTSVQCSTMAMKYQLCNFIYDEKEKFCQLGKLNSNATQFNGTMINIYSKGKLLNLKKLHVH